MDFFTVPTLTGRVLFVLVLLTHHRRRILHLAVTEHPTAAWTAQQIIEAFPNDTAPRWRCGIAMPSTQNPSTSYFRGMDVTRKLIRRDD